jgi:hypothetical protein
LENAVAASGAGKLPTRWTGAALEFAMAGFSLEVARMFETSDNK